MIVCDVCQSPNRDVDKLHIIFKNERLRVGQEDVYKKLEYEICNKCFEVFQTKFYEFIRDFQVAAIKEVNK